MILSCINGDGNPVENVDTQECASCGAARRKSERNASKVKVVRPIRKVSPKMAKDLQDYSVLRRQYLHDHETCEVNLFGCTYHSIEVHHSAKRGRNLLNQDTFVAACRHCHDMIEFKMSAEERRELGLLRTVEGTI